VAILCIRKIGFEDEFRAAMAGNHAYWAEQELAGALTSLGVPYLVLHKESFKSRGFYEFCERVTEEGRAPFKGRRIMVYCEDEKQVQLRSRVAPPEAYDVTGMPRLDAVHAARRARAAAGEDPARRPAILFFSFTENAGLPCRLPITALLHERFSPEDHELLKLRWKRLAPLLHRTMVEIARQNPDIDVIVKAKKADLPSVEGWLRADGSLPANLEICAHRAELSDLLSRCDVVCGLATAALVEAIAADRPIVVPMFEEVAEPAYTPFIPDYGGLVERVESVEAMVERLSRIAREKRPPRLEPTAEQERYLQECIGNPDGQAGRRVRETVMREIGAGPMPPGP
jgi:hypothetical protein